MTSAPRSRLFGWSAMLLSACGMSALVSACEEPRFPEDAGIEDTGIDGSAGETLAVCDSATCVAPEQRDGEAPATTPDGGLDAPDNPRARWVGRYATYTQLFANAVPPSFAEYLTLAEIKREGEGLVLEQQLCQYSGGWNAVLLAGSVRYVYPAQAKTRAELTYDSEKFNSPVMTFLVGLRDSVAACGSGAVTAPALPEQVWMGGASCECSDAAVPASIKDCRVLDPDADKKPGATMRALINADGWDYYVTQQQRIRHINGYRQGERLFANFEASDSTQIWGCGGLTPPGCPLTGAPLCPPAYNKTVFVPVDASFNCQKVIDQSVGLFNPMQPPFPQACAADLSSTKP